MSASFKNEKKKFNQNDLRRLMNEHKVKQGKTSKKIESPLAKYPFLIFYVLYELYTNIILVIIIYY